MPGRDLTWPSLRLRLTLLFLGQFLIAALLLVGLTWFVYRQQGSGGVVQAVTGGPVTDAGSAPAGAAVAQVAIQASSLTADQILTLAFQALVATTAVALVVGWWLAGRVLHPLHRITSTARELSASNLDRRIALGGGGDELQQLADTFDAMLDRLQAAFESQRRFVANASHELRTPLAVQQTVADVVLADPRATAGELRIALDEVRKTAGQQRRIIDGLLVLADAERDVERWTEVDLAAVTEAALAGVAGEAGRRRIEVDARLEPAPAAGDAELLARMVGNLIENGVRHNHDEGWLRVGSGSVDGRAWVEVANSGEGVPAAAVPRLYEPFVRLAGRTASGEGQGLGLSIVRAVVNAHGGRVETTARREGGLVVRVTLRSS